MTTPINIPFALVPSNSLAGYAALRTFTFIAGGASPGASHVKIWGSANGIDFPPTSATPLVELGGEAPTKTINDLSLRYRAQVTTGTGVVLTVDVTTDCCEGAAGALNTLALPDFPTGGEVTTSANVDQFGAFAINQTTPDQVLTFPAPTDPNATYTRVVSNVGSVSFSLYGIVVLPGSSVEIIWNGTTWTTEGTGSSTLLRTLTSAASRPVLDSDGSTTLLGNTDVVAPGNSLLLASGSGGGLWAIDNGGSLTLDVAGSIDIGPGIGGAINIRPRVGAGNVGRIRFFELAANGTNYIGLKTADAVAASIDYTLPEAPTIGGQHLTSTPGGVMTWRGATDVAAGNASGQAIADGAAAAVVTGWTETIDSAAAFSAATGVFTAPVAGTYQVSAQLEYVASVSILNGEFSAQIFVNGVVAAIGALQSQVAVGASRHQARVTHTVALTAGQTIDIRAAQNGGAGAVLLTADVTRNLVSISLVT